MTTEVAADEELPAEATSAGLARRLVRTALRDHDQEQVLDAAQLAISEIVTNALVHAGTPMRLRILLADASVRIELTDGNGRLPQHRDFGHTALTGRGLHLVEELVTRWGAYPVPDGKVVWFEISDEPLPGVPDPDHESGQGVESVLHVELHRMPLLMHLAWQEHAAALLRELMLVRLDAELSALQEHASASDALGLLLDQVPALEVGIEPDTVMANATEPGVSVRRLLIHIPRASLPGFEALDVLLDEALHLAEDGHLLSPPTQPEIQAMRLWICEQIRTQAAGGSSSAWPSMSSALPPADRLSELHWDPEEVNGADTALIAADDANRIVAVSPSALRLLGYDAADQLVGRRLVAIIPERFHQAHVAGFTLHLLNGRDPLLDKRVMAPVVTAAGPEVELALVIRSRSLPQGRHLFVAEFYED